MYMCTYPYVRMYNVMMHCINPVELATEVGDILTRVQPTLTSLSTVAAS